MVKFLVHSLTPNSQQILSSVIFLYCVFSQQAPPRLHSCKETLLWRLTERSSDAHATDTILGSVLKLRTKGLSVHLPGMHLLPVCPPTWIAGLEHLGRGLSLQVLLL